jgi:protein involved in polysaccharide export with SLBB domain
MVSFVRFNSICGGALKTKTLYILLLAVLLSTCLAGCSDKVRLPSTEQLTEFNKAGPCGPAVDMQRVVRAKMEAGPYRVVPGDVLELSMPIVLQVLVTEVPDFPDKIAPYLCRVGDDGLIVLPMVGQIQAAGKTLPQIESAIINAYYPTYTRTRPSVIARVAEYKTHKVAISGAVQKPGFYELRTDQLSLVALLMQAGGIIEEGAARIKITHTSPAKADIIDKQALSQSTKADRIKFAPHYLGSSQDDDSDAQMTFQQSSPSSTIGRLTIKHQQTILLSEQIDITDEIQRWAILDKLAKTNPRVETSEVGRIWARLCELAKLLNNPGIQKTEDRRQETEDRIQKTYSEPQLSRARLGEAIASDNDEGRWTNDNGRMAKDNRSVNETIVLPVKGLNIPFADVALNAGDIVEVEPLDVSVFTVVGLVNKPGNFPYPPNAQYNLMQAIAFAGGLDIIAEPRYAAVYRLKADGMIVRATFEIIRAKGAQLTEALNIHVKPGDIVAIEHTPRTRSNLFLERMFRVNVGAYIPLTDVWD